MTWKFPVFVALVGVCASVACGSSDDEAASGSCDAICDCVSAKYSAKKSDCMPICDSVKNDHPGDESACESTLDSYSYPDCKSECSGF